nr:dienelactone hydrolase family protein [Plastoroseomonas arctica]
MSVDGANGRIDVDAWYPAEAPAQRRPGTGIVHPALAPHWRGADFATPAGRAPVILYQPSWFSHRRENSFMLANLASHGFVALALDDIRRYPGAAGPEAALRAAALDQGSEAAMERSLGVVAERVALAGRIGAAALDAFAADTEWAGRIDAGRVGVLGFSFGGAIAAEMARANPRVLAGINLDGSTYGEAGRLGAGRPFLTLFGDAPFPPAAERIHPDPAIRLEAALTLIETQRQLAQASRPATWCFSFEGARHGDFSDALVVPPITSLGEARNLDRRALWGAINAYVLAFLDHTLRGAAPGLLDGAPPQGVRRLREMQPLAGSGHPGGSEPWPV